MESQDGGEPRSDGFTPYQRRLLLFLSVATFFEGYDFLALTQLLPHLDQEFGFDRFGAGALVGFINLGTVLAFQLVKGADRWGRKRVLTLTILGYTLFTVVSGLATNLYLFAVAQLVARIFLLAEWAVSMVIAAEEFPANRRGHVIGLVQASSSLGSVACAGLVPLMVESALGWRMVYFVGAVPLLLLAYARRGLRETTRFRAVAPSAPPSFFRIFSTPYRGRVLVLGAIWFFAYIAAQNSIAFFKPFAVDEAGLSDRQAGLAISLAAIVSMPMLFYSGRMLDLLGRRLGACVVFGVGALGTVGCYVFDSFVPLTCALVLGIYGASAYLPLLNAYTAELVPTHLRGDAFAWSNNLIGRLSYVASPIVVGALAERLGGFGRVVPYTAVFSLVALGIVLVALPETSSRELEDTAALH